MRRRTLVSACLLLFSVAAESQEPRGQQRGSLAGSVSTRDAVPVSHVRVTMVEAGRTIYTDQDGLYTVPHLAAGLYTVTFARLGFAPFVRRVTIAGPTRLDVVLQQAHVELPAVQAVATAGALSVFASPQPTSVLEGAALRTAHGASVGDAIEGLPGLRSMSMSPGIGKPVIRGLTSNRVVVVDDGQRLETQQWGSDHSPNVETTGASRIEVLRGPASVLYGSDALGGVVNIVRPPPPDAIGITPFLRTRATSAYSTNPGGIEGSVMAEGAVSGWGNRFSVSRRTSDDLRAPGARLFNTGNAATNVELATSVRGERASVGGSYVVRRERIEIYEDPVEFPRFTGYQRILENRATLRATTHAPSGRFELLGTHERNERREFEGVADPDVALGLLARTTIVQLSFHHAGRDRLSGTVGASVLDTRFTKFGRETLIPSNAGKNFAVYAFETADLGAWSLSAGMRYDARMLETPGDSVLQLQKDRRSWRALTGNFGALYRLAEPLALVLNLGRGFRAPSAADLFSHGYHEGTRAFEIGDPELGVESSLNVDLAVRAQTTSLNAELGVFANRIRDYIYLEPRGSLDTLVHAQGDALISGVEAHADYAPIRWLALRTTLDYTRGQNTTVAAPLPLIPPARAMLRVRLQPVGRSYVQSPYVAVAWEGHAAQRRLHPGDLGTPGYGLWHLSGGGTFTRRSSVLTVDLQLRNALDRRYRNFMSAYKTIADAPGRAVTVRLGVDM